MATDVLTVNARCDQCDVTVTAVVVDDSMSADVAEFFRAHTHHAPPAPPPTPTPAASPLRRMRLWARRSARAN